jgi:hypothetical protein
MKVPKLLNRYYVVLHVPFEFIPGMYATNFGALQVH